MSVTNICAVDTGRNGIQSLPQEAHILMEKRQRKTKLQFKVMRPSKVRKQGVSDLLWDSITMLSARTLIN